MHCDFTVALAEVASIVPDVIAVEEGDRSITYAELHRRVCALGDAIATARRDPGNQLVAALLEHGVDAVVGHLGALMAGLVTAPMDAREPAERLARLLEVADPAVIVASRQVAAAAGDVIGDRPLVIIEDVADHDATPMRLPLAPPDEPGLVLFTSGSTGVPKGVVIPRAVIVPATASAGTDLGYGPGDRLPMITSFGFVGAAGMVGVCLMNGATLCTYDLKGRGQLDLPAWVREQRITRLSLIPSVLRALADAPPGPPMDTVRSVGLGGEAAYAADVRRARHLFRPDTVFSVGLAATEFQGATRYVVPPDDELDDGPFPAGEVLEGVRVEVLDPDTDEAVAPGEPGRLVVMSDLVALGYWKDPELTAEHFFTLPDGTRGFRSNDRVRFRPDGLLEHLGRLDSRVKVHGAMVATSEVERALLTCTGVAQAAVIGVPDAAGSTKLVAYVVPERGEPLGVSQLRREVATRVPSTMIPRTFVLLESLPLGVRGKLDRSALPPPPDTVEHPYREPADDRERALAAIFTEVLGLERVGADDDFFDLGGDSFAVVELVAAVAEEFGTEIDVTTVLEAPTVATLTRHVAGARVHRASTVVPLRAERDGVPFFCFTGAGGPALGLLALADATPGHPFYGVQQHAIEHRALPDRSVQAIARRAAADIRAVKPHGPYLLGGFSFGAVVAFEVACLLAGDGHEVAAVIAMDAPVPGELRGPTRRARVHRRARALDAATPGTGWRRGPRLAAKTASALVGSAVAHAGRRYDVVTAGILPRRGAAQYDVFYRYSMHLLRRYRSDSVFTGPFTVLRAAENAHTDAVPTDLGWSRRVTGPITVIDVPGDHFSMLRPPRVSTLGARLAEVLDAATSGSSGSSTRNGSGRPA